MPEPWRCVRVQIFFALLVSYWSGSLVRVRNPSLFLILLMGSQTFRTQLLLRKLWRKRRILSGLGFQLFGKPWWSEKLGRGCHLWCQGCRWGKLSWFSLQFRRRGEGWSGSCEIQRYTWCTDGRLLQVGWRDWLYNNLYQCPVPLRYKVLQTRPLSRQESLRSSCGLRSSRCHVPHRQLLWILWTLVALGRKLQGRHLWFFLRMYLCTLLAFIRRKKSVYGFSVSWDMLFKIQVEIFLL